MSIVDYTPGMVDAGNTHPLGGGHSLHRIAAVRRLQGISRRTIARRFKVEVAEVRRQEDETSDLSLSTLYEWQKALEVPVAELLVESDDSLSRPLLQRAQLVRLMKTALALLERAKQEAPRLMAQTIVDQLVELMPELKGVSAWLAVGKRRSCDELGVAATRTLSDSFFLDRAE